MSKIIIYSPNVVGKSMAGPAIRSWEMANVLSTDHEVILMTPNQSDLQTSNFQLVAKNAKGSRAYFKNGDVLITQTLSPFLAWLAKSNGLKIIIDAYDPVPLELLEQFKHHPISERDQLNRSSIANLIFSFKMADSILCASEKQRDLWLGFLLAHQLITPTAYDADNSLRQLIDVVPFGLSEKLPQKRGDGIREKYHLSASDNIVLWGGGIWNWFDPLTLIKAVKQLSLSRSDIKLVFMGLKNPDPSVPQMTMAHEAVQLATNLGLINQFVFFNMDWIPYDERQNFLLDATIGVSTHFDHLETRFSFRTRMLDYIWAELPIIATQGDSFADLIDSNELGVTLPYQNEKAIVDAITAIADDKEKIKRIKQNLIQMKKQFYWKEVMKPVEGMIARFATEQKSQVSYGTIRNTAHLICCKIKEKGVKGCMKKILGRLRGLIS